MFCLAIQNGNIEMHKKTVTATVAAFQKQYAYTIYWIELMNWNAI